ncbi:hypothetical protein SNEBB_000646 [Seison nebaliae]|nr:hypothetical protein SNEBB_000646 [Seison nebaliae]
MYRLPPRFIFMDFAEQQVEIDMFYHGTARKICGFYNTDDLGVCLTNVLLSLILSSKKLLSKVRKVDHYDEKPMEAIKTNPIILVESIKNSIDYVDVLSHGIRQIADNKPDKPPYGVAGDYHLAKSYRNMECKYNGTISCERLIILSKDMHCSFERLDTILYDLYDSDYYTFYEKYLVGSWHPDLQLFNIIYNYDKAPMSKNIDNPWIVKRLPSNMLGKLASTAAEAIGIEFTMMNVDPEFLALWFGSSNRPEFQPVFFDSFIAQIIDLLDNNRNVSFYAVRNLNVVFKPSTIKIPLNLHSNRRKTYHLPLNGYEDKKYFLRTILLTLQEHFTVKLKKMPFVPMESNVEIGNCTIAGMMTLEETIEVLNNKRLIQYTKINFNNIAKIFWRICSYFVKNQNTPNFYPEYYGSHGIALINNEKNEWILMNDDKSFMIDDIGVFQYHLRYQRLSTAFFERIQPGVPSSTLITPKT